MVCEACCDSPVCVASHRYSLRLCTIRRQLFVRMGETAPQECRVALSDVVDVVVLQAATRWRLSPVSLS